MPSATPLPRSPSQLTLFGAADMLTSAGCPACRYVAEAGDRLLTWFALEAHAEAGTVTRLCGSLGPCPRHSRALIGQPGADGRLTVLYRSLLRAGQDYLRTGKSPHDGCLFCRRDADAAGRALDTLLAELQEEEIRRRYRDLGGLCVPHLRAAAARGSRRQAGWLAEVALSRLAAGRPDPGMLAGDDDTDAEARARLRAALRPAAGPAPAFSADNPAKQLSPDGICAICLAAAQAERDQLTGLTARGDRQPRRAWPGLCAEHLHDTWARSRLSGRIPDVGWTLEREGERTVAWLTRTVSQGGGRVARRPLARRAGSPGSWDAACPPCQARQDAADAGARRILPVIRSQSDRAAHPGQPWLCLRHVMKLRKIDRRTAQAAARTAGGRADFLTRELEQAFRLRTWAHRHEPRGREMDAWRRAAGFIDGRVYGGGLPPARN